MNPPKLCPSSVQRPPSGAVGPSSCGRRRSQSLTMLSALQPATWAPLSSQPWPSSSRHRYSQPSQYNQPHSRAHGLREQQLTVVYNSVGSAASSTPAAFSSQPWTSSSHCHPYSSPNLAHSPSHAVGPAAGQGSLFTGSSSARTKQPSKLQLQLLTTHELSHAPRSS